VADLLRIIDGQEAALLSMESGAAAVASAPLRSRVQRIIAQALAAFARLPEGADIEPLLASIREQLGQLGVNVTDALLADFAAAQALGVEHGNAQAFDVRDDVKPKAELPADVLAAATGVNAAVKAKLLDAAGKLVGVRNLPELVAGLSRANMAVTAIEIAAKWGVNRAAASGVATVAREVGASRLWVGERDACLHCTAYMGQVADGVAPFAGGLTFAKKPLSSDPVPNPPLHPNCRCRISLYRHEWSRPGQVSVPDALKREARRSVARGFSLPTESEASRLSAADRLLLNGAGLPKTVEERARRDVERGAFARGRRTP
jgi:hypothetical protein